MSIGRLARAAAESVIASEWAFELAVERRVLLCVLKQHS